MIFAPLVWFVGGVISWRGNPARMYLRVLLCQMNLKLVTLRTLTFSSLISKLAIKLAYFWVSYCGLQAFSFFLNRAGLLLSKLLSLNKLEAKIAPMKNHQKDFIASISALSLPHFFLSRAYTLWKIGHRFALGKGWLIFQQKLILLNWKNENNFKVKFGVPLTSQLSKYAQKSNKRIILK